MTSFEEKLEYVFTVSRQVKDVVLSNEDLIWRAQQKSRNTGSTAASTETIKLSQVVGVLLKEEIKTDKDGKNIHGFAVFFCQQSKRRKLKLASCTFESNNRDACILWVEKINSLLKEFSNRPQKLKIFINPYGGQGKAPRLYFKKIAPIFNQAGIETDVILTERAGHAWEFLKTADMNSFDGVVCVGGDGIVHEVVNGLLEKVHLDAGMDLANGKMSQDFKALELPTRVGIIAAGSTDVIVYSAQGTNDPVTSALHIVMGKLNKVLVQQHA